MNMYFIIEDTQNEDEAIFGASNRSDAEKINVENFDGEAVIRQVDEAEFRAEGFDPEGAEREIEEIVRIELAEMCDNIAKRLDTYMEPPVAQVRVRNAF